LNGEFDWYSRMAFLDNINATTNEAADHNQMPGMKEMNRK
jgi:hypothetical protein